MFKTHSDPASPDTYTHPNELDLLQYRVHLEKRMCLNLPEQLLDFAGLGFAVNQVDGYCTRTYCRASALFRLRAVRVPT